VKYGCPGLVKAVVEARLITFGWRTDESVWNSAASARPEAHPALGEGGRRATPLEASTAGAREGA